MRRRIVSLVGIVVVPAAAYQVPFVSPYASVFIGAGLAMLMVWIKPASPLRELGLTRPPRVWRALALGVGVGIALLLISRLILTPLIEHMTGVRRDLTSFDYLRGNTRAILALLPSVWLSAGLCEEIVYRGYLITQVTALLGQSRLALFAALGFASTIFALAHWYQGLTGMLLTGALAMLFGILFLQERQNLWANVAAHLTGDTASLILIGVSADRWLDHLGRMLILGQ
jgi:membrane protease YdiL (CAAX protease family)